MPVCSIGEKEMCPVLRDPPQHQLVEIVTSLIKEHCGYDEVELWKKIAPPQIMSYSEFSEVIEYLFNNGKIASDDEGHICWIYNPELTRQFLSNPALLIK